MGLAIGAIQVPPDGRPIVMLVDRPVTGGYPVPACVIRADVGRVAGLRTGDSRDVRAGLHRGGARRAPADGGRARRPRGRWCAAGRRARVGRSPRVS